MFFFIILCNICVQVIAWNNKTQPTYKFGIKSKCSLLNVDRSGPNIHHFCRVIVGRGRKGYTVFPAWKKETGQLKPGLSLSRRRSVYCNYNSGIHCVRTYYANKLLFFCCFFFQISSGMFYKMSKPLCVKKIHQWEIFWLKFCFHIVTENYFYYEKFKKPLYDEIMQVKFNYLKCTIGIF